MIIKNQLIEVKWTSRNRKHYESFGYIFTNVGDIFYVNPEHLQKCSSKEFEVECDYCRSHYFVTADNYFHQNKTINPKDACDHCKVKKQYESSFTSRVTSLYNRALKMCESKGYEFASTMDDITGNTSRIKYICPKHGIHEMRISNFLSGKGCPDCVPESNRDRFKLKPEDIISSIEKCGGKLLNPDDYINNQTKNLRILCPDCNRPFTTSYRSFIQHGGQLCNECSSNGESLGERKVRLFLEDNNISFKQYHWFSDCRDIKPLPFDFYLDKLNIIIEFDGSQHYYPSNGYFTRAEDTQRHDEIKNKYCEEHGIKLIRIPYWKFDRIEEILSEELLNPHKDIV